MNNDDWSLIITDSVEYRGYAGHRQCYIYKPMVVPPQGHTEPLDSRVCDHRHTSYDAAMRCGERLLRQVRRKQS